MSQYPDIPEKTQPMTSYKVRYASMGLGVALSRILTLEVYKEGLRIKFLRLFGVFNRPIFVPWNEISVQRQKSLWGIRAVLYLGSESSWSTLKINSDLADCLWRNVGALWPEKGSAPPIPPTRAILKKVFLEWLGMTALASTFFIVASRLAPGSSNTYPPIAVCVLFPGIVLGMVSIWQYFARVREIEK